MIKKTIKKYPSLANFIKKLRARLPFLAPIIRIIFPKKKQISNLIYLANDIEKKQIKPRSFPVDITLSLSNVCNLSCPICSVNNLRKNNLPRVVNNISSEQIKAFSPVFDNALKLNFMGFVGESILNPEFDQIISYLKLNYNLSLFVSTNGMGLNPKIQDTMLDIGFDSINYSVHASTPKTYAKLQGGNFDTVISNLIRLANQKKQKNLLLPNITIVYALNKENIKETDKMIDLAADLKIKKLILYHYRDYGISELSLDKDPYAANMLIDDIYSYAREKRAISILPNLPPYFKEYKPEEEDNKEIQCDLQWTGLQMRASYSHQDSLYLECCNVFNAFLFIY